MKINIPQQYIDDGLIRVQKHPTLDLYIYNYTEKTQYAKLWDEYTLMCRGLILDGEGNIVARPFKKFFNLAEVDKVPDGEFELHEKMDGSLGILYWDNGIPKLATRGSFVSEQAVRGTEMLNFYQGLYRLRIDKTYLFEIIYPENRIVVNYGEECELYLLAIIDNDTGEEMSLLEAGIPFKRPTVINKVDIKELNKLTKGNAEGFVLKWLDGTRVKYKFEEYVRLHRLITGISNKSIWEILKSGEPKAFEELLTKVPDEYYDWVQKVKAELESNFQEILNDSTEVFMEAQGQPSRKEQALFILKHPKGRAYSGVVFAMLDGKEYPKIIWQMIKPAVTSSFKITTEDV